MKLPPKWPNYVSNPAFSREYLIKMYVRLATWGIFTSLWVYEILILSGSNSTLYYIWKFSTLNWFAVNLTIVYLTLDILNSELSLRIPARILSYLYLLSVSSNAMVIIGYWSLYIIEPDMMVRLTNPVSVYSFLLTLFFHGGNLALVLMNIFSFPKFFPFAIKHLAILEVFCFLAYFAMVNICKTMTGRNVYGFMDEVDSVVLGIFYSALYVIGLVVKLTVSRLIQVKNKVKGL